MESFNHLKTKGRIEDTGILASQCKREVFRGKRLTKKSIRESLVQQNTTLPYQKERLFDVILEPLCPTKRDSTKCMKDYRDLELLI
jgi:hypothetical protein